MNLRLFVLPILCGLLVLVGCTSSPTVHSNTASQQVSAMIGEIAKLEGNWEMTDEKGEKKYFKFDVTSGGSAVREIMFPGDPHEMTNFYHMDGDQLVVTHYCAAGNQPRMVASEAVETTEGTAFNFQFDSVTNLQESHKYYMGNLTLTILKNGDIRQDWRSIAKDGSLTEPMTFLLARRSTMEHGDVKKAGFNK